jgi:NADH:ubiquinone oxidoreductase subunit E
LSELKIIYNLNSIKIFIKKYKPNGEQFSILDMLDHLIKKYHYEYAKNIKSVFSDLTKTKKQHLKRSKKTYKRN